MPLEDEEGWRCFSLSLVSPWRRAGLKTFSTRSGGEEGFNLLKFLSICLDLVSFEVLLAG